jgi:hypothetical protein
MKAQRAPIQLPVVITGAMVTVANVEDAYGALTSTIACSFAKARSEVDTFKPLILPNDGKLV